MERGTGQSVNAGTAVSKESPQMHWKRKKIWPKYKKGKKSVRWSLPKRIITEFKLKDGAVHDPDKKKLNSILSEVAKKYVYEEDYKNFRLTVRRRLDCFFQKEKNHVPTGEVRGRGCWFTQCIRGWRRNWRLLNHKSFYLYLTSEGGPRISIASARVRADN